jgi:hypothetical protein
LTRGAALAVPALALAACGGSTTSNSLEDAAKETAESSSRVEMSYTVADGSSHGSMRGAFDYAAERAIVTEFEFVEDGKRIGDESQPTEVRSVGGVDYVAHEVKGKTYWVKERAERRATDPYALLAPIPGGSHDPSDVFSIVLRASDKITNLGPEEVHGDEATHYRASLDLDKLAESVPAAQRDEFLEGMKRDAMLPVDVWVDEESRLRRVSIREQLEQEAAIVITFDLFDFGVDVDVEPPPADQLITQERLYELTGEGSAGLGDEELEALCREEAPKDEADEICEGTEADE